jgi:hypothetical protein
VDKRTREQIRAVERAGVEVVDVTMQGNTHMRVHVKAPDGRTGFLTIPCSPKDGTGAANIARGKARQFLQGRNFRGEYAAALGE